MPDLTLPALIRPDLALVVSRLLAKTTFDGEWHGTPHWLVDRGLNGRGYIQIMMPGTDRKMILAHRIGQEAFVGPIEDGNEVDHCCQVTNCWSPLHTESVTAEENRRRAIAARTSCRKGHLYTPETTHWTKSASGATRRCLTCRAAWGRARRASIA